MNMSVLFFVLGLLFGSFLNCMAMRVVRKEDWVKEPSRCRECGHKLGPADLIPVFSYVFSRGRCRYCKERISLRYPVTELVFAALTVLIYLRYGISFETLRSFILACSLFHFPHFVTSAQIRMAMATANTIIAFVFISQ